MTYDYMDCVSPVDLDFQACGASKPALWISYFRCQSPPDRKGNVAGIEANWHENPVWESVCKIAEIF